VQHRVEVDQSIRIEQTHRDTVLAFSDGIERAVVIPAPVKQACQRALRAKGVKPSMSVLRMFAAGLLLLLEGQMERMGSVTIDAEYPGKEGELKGLLLRFVLQWVPDFPRDAITFRQIGKRSRAHTLAWNTQRGQRQPDRYATVEELLRYC